MRTELLQALDAFEGLVIFASNLPDSYDVAIESRLLHVDFGLPDREARVGIWRTHLPAELPRADDVSIEELAEIDGVLGPGHQDSCGHGRDRRSPAGSGAGNPGRTDLSPGSSAQLTTGADRGEHKD